MSPFLRVPRASLTLPHADHLMLALPGYHLAFIFLAFPHSSPLEWELYRGIDVNRVLIFANAHNSELPQVLETLDLDF